MKKLSIPNETLRSLYVTMLRIRMVEEKIAELYPQQEIRCPVHLCIGEEAVAVGICATLSNDDYAFSNHRSHGHYLAKGGDLKAMMAELYGKATGCSRGKGGSMHLISPSVGFLGATPIVGSTIPIAVGAALGTVMRDEQRVTVVFFGDAAVETGVFHESLNFAALKRLPVIFVCENNLYSVQSPLPVRQPEAREIYWLARGHGIESLQGNGNDVIEVYSLARKAIEKARQGNGPTFLEFKTYRWREHVGPFYDYDLGYRTKSEVQQWMRRCPIKKLGGSLVRSSILCNEDIERVKRKIEVEIDEAVIFAKNSPVPEESCLLEYIQAP